MRLVANVTQTTGCRKLTNGGDVRKASYLRQINFRYQNKEHIPLNWLSTYKLLNSDCASTCNNRSFICYRHPSFTLSQRQWLLWYVMSCHRVVTFLCAIHSDLNETKYPNMMNSEVESPSFVDLSSLFITILSIDFDEISNIKTHNSCRRKYWKGWN